MATIVVKIFALALRTAAKPLGHQFQQWAMQHPGFRLNAISVAQVHQQTIRRCTLLEAFMVEAASNRGLYQQRSRRQRIQSICGTHVG